MKKYIAKTNVSINIVLPNGTNSHIAFSALSGGGSVFYTDDPSVIQAMESHYKYGTLFRAVPSQSDEQRGIVKSHTATSQAVAKNEAVRDEGASKTSNIESETQEAKVIVVSDPDAAKAYLAEHFGISRTKIKTVSAIKEAAKNNGIEFSGI